MVAAPLLLAGLERGVLADGDEHVLEQAAAARVGMDVAGDHRLETELAREPAQGGVSALVAAFVGTLQLDEEALPPEGAGKLAGGVRLAHAEPVPGAAREADEAFVSLDQLLNRKSRCSQLPLPPGRSRVRVRAREQATEVRVAAGGSRPAASGANHSPTSARSR